GKTLDLAETAVCEFPAICALHHTADPGSLELNHPARSLEGRHGTAQLVGFRGLKPCRRDGDLHHLLLKERNAQRPLQNRLELRLLVMDLLALELLLPSLQIRVHHIALDRARADDRHFDDQIVEAPWL